MNWTHIKHGLWGSLLPLLFISACSTENDVSIPPERPTKTISGNAVDAIITNGDIRAYAWDDGIQGELLGESTIDGNGFYKLDIRSTDRPIKLVVSNGRYTEEASGVSVQMVEGQTMSALIYYEQDTDVSVQINPYTHLAACYAQYKVSTGSNAQNAITASTSAFSALTGVDIIGTFPLNITDPANANFEVTDGLRFGSLLAGISSFTAQTSEDNGVSAHRFNQNSSIYFAQVACQDIMADGLLNGLGFVNNGTTIGQLALGSVTLSTNTYRLIVAQHVLNIMSSDRNATGLDVSKFVQFSNQYAQSTDAMFGSEPPQPVDQTGPVITSTTAQGTYLKGIVDLGFQVSDPLGVKSISFEVNGLFFSEGQSSNPVISLNTLGYTDGPITVKVTALDVLDNPSEVTYTFNVDNSSPIVTLSSPTLVNSQTYQATGSYQLDGSPVSTITVNGTEAAIDTANRTWSATVSLVSGQNTLDLEVVDSAGNTGSFESRVDVDLIYPLLEPFGTNVRFTTYEGQLNLCTLGQLTPQTGSNNPVCISTDNVSLNGTVLSGSIQNQGYVLLGFSPSDPQGAGVFTDQADLTVEYRYEVNDQLQVDWTTAPKTVDGSNRFYYFPMVTEYLGDNWYQTKTSDVHKITFRATDKAGNASDLSYELSFDVLIPAITATSTISNKSLFTNNDFSTRASVDGQLINVDYKIDNPSNTAYYISLNDDENHSVDHKVETAIRENMVRAKLTEEWYARNCGTRTNWSDPGCSSVGEESLITSVSFTRQHRFYGQSISPSEILYSAYQVVYSDNPVISDLREIPEIAPLSGYSCAKWDVVNYVDDHWSSPVYANGNTKFTVCRYFNDDSFPSKPLVSSLRSEINKSIETMDGYPRNVRTVDNAVYNMQTERISVLNDSIGQEIMPISSWYRIPPKTSIKIVKSVRTPSILHSTDSEVAQADFSSYTEKKLDSSTSWNIDTNIEITRAIDPGSVDQLSNVTQYTETFGSGIEVYTISR